MTDDQKYSSVLKEIGEIIAQKNSVIEMKEFEIKMLKRQLEDAENHIERSRKEN